MQIRKEEIIHIAKLANLNLTEEEIEKYTNDMQDILALANTINQVDTEGVDEKASLEEKYNVFRKDDVKVFKDRDDLLQNAPAQEDGMFRIPKVIK